MKKRERKKKEKNPEIKKAQPNKTKKTLPNPTFKLRNYLNEFRLLNNSGLAILFKLIIMHLDHSIFSTVNVKNKLIKVND